MKKKLLELIARYPRPLMIVGSLLAAVLAVALFGRWMHKPLVLVAVIFVLSFAASFVWPPR